MMCALFGGSKVGAPRLHIHLSTYGGGGESIGVEAETVGGVRWFSQYLRKELLDMDDWTPNLDSERLFQRLGDGKGERSR